MLKLNETFGSDNIKWFVVWNVIIIVYMLVFKGSLLSLIFFAVTLLIAGKLVWRLIEKRMEAEGNVDKTVDYLSGWSDTISDTIYEVSNGLLNWLARIFTNNDILEIGLGMLLLYLIEMFCFYASDVLIVYMLGNLIILLRGFKEVSRYYLSNFILMKENIKSNLQQWLPKSTTK
jgi:hypothetical protein